MSQTVTMTISPAGRVVIDAEGFEGCGCEEATAAIELVLGGAAKKDHKPEYYASPAVNTAQSIRNQF
jgi:hypothetical protein